MNYTPTLPYEIGCRTLRSEERISSREDHHNLPPRKCHLPDGTNGYHSALVIVENEHVGRDVLLRGFAATNDQNYVVCFRVIRHVGRF